MKINPIFTKGIEKWKTIKTIPTEEKSRQLMGLGFVMIFLGLAIIFFFLFILILLFIIF